MACAESGMVNYFALINTIILDKISRPAVEYDERFVLVNGTFSKA